MDRWIVEGRCALPFDVPEDDDEVDFEAVEGKVPDLSNLSQPAESQGCALETDLRLPGAIVEDGSARSPGDDLNRLRRAREELESPEGLDVRVPQTPPPQRLRTRLGAWSFPTPPNPRWPLTHAVMRASEGEGSEEKAVPTGPSSPAELRAVAVGPVLTKAENAGWTRDYGEPPAPPARERVRPELSSGPAASSLTPSGTPDRR